MLILSQPLPHPHHTLSQMDHTSRLLARCPSHPHIVESPMLPSLPWLPSVPTKAHGFFHLAALSWPLETSPALSLTFRPSPSGRQPRCWLPATSSCSHLKTLTYALSSDPSTLENINLFLKHRGSLPHPPNGGVTPHPMVPHHYFRSPVSPLVTS